MPWGLDLGTTNTGVARWDDARGQPQLVELPAVCRAPDRDDPLEAPRLIPSAVHVLERPRLRDRLGAWPPLARRLFVGRWGLIGRRALDKNYGVAHPACLRKAAREAVAQIQSRLGGASPGQLSLAGGDGGALSLAEEDPRGQVSVTNPPTAVR
jgi:hypothetical protein